MTSGQVLSERALQKIGAHSLFSPADPQAFVIGVETLNSMLENWLSKGIQIGFTPMDVPADDANEPPDTRNAVINNLALELAPYFDNGKVVVSPELARVALKDFIDVKNSYQAISVPDKVVSSTLPVGQGNQIDSNSRIFFARGQTIGESN